MVDGRASRSRRSAKRLRNSHVSCQFQTIRKPLEIGINAAGCTVLPRVAMLAHDTCVPKSERPRHKRTSRAGLGCRVLARGLPWRDSRCYQQYEMAVSFISRDGDSVHRSRPADSTSIAEAAGPSGRNGSLCPNAANLTLLTSHRLAWSSWIPMIRSHAPDMRNANKTMIAIAAI